MSVSDNFKALCSALVVDKKETISQRYKAITKRLNADFYTANSETSHSLYVGSYGRNTAIKGLSDVDMLFQLPYAVYDKYNKYTSNGQSALLQAVRSSINTTYSGTSIGADGQVVVVPFNDGITFEVLPAFINPNGSYTFPDTNNGGSWKVTNPQAEMSEMRKVNDECNDNLKHLCRMMRAWKRRNSVSIPSFLIDTLAYSFIKSWAHRDKSFVYYDFMTRDFLYYLSQRDRTQQFWAAPGSGQRVHRNGTFEHKARASYERSLEAIQYDSDRKAYSAQQAWQDIFGNYYP